MSRICQKCGREYFGQTMKCIHCNCALVEKSNSVTSQQTRGRTTQQTRQTAAQINYQRVQQARAEQENIRQQQQLLLLEKEQEKEKRNKKGHKNSTLGILALIFSAIGCTFWLGIILAIVDLCRKDGKKKTCSGIALCICGVLIALASFLSMMGGNLSNSTSTKTQRSIRTTQNQNAIENKEDENNSTQYHARGDLEYSQNTTNYTEPREASVDSQQSEEQWERPESSNKNDYSVDILAEYTLPDSINWYTRRFMIIRNNSSETVEVNTSSIAYGQDGSMVSAAESTFYALGAGCTSVVYEAFETDKAISRYETDLKVDKDSYFESVIQDLTYTQNNIEDGAIFQVTNNGSEPADFVEGYALFFKNGQLVEYQSAYFSDSDGELKSGATISKQFSAYEDFDRMEFYLTGRR